MSITVQENQRFFSIRTAHTEYQMFADRYGVLKHLWYGEKVGNNMSYLLDYPDVGFSGNPNDVGDLRTYSLDTLPLEYPCSGSGDYRITSLSAVGQNGTCAADLRYAGHRILSGKYTIPGLPASHGDDAETLEITLRDQNSGLCAVLRYGVFEELDIITRSVELVNDGADAIILKQADSLCLDLPRNRWEWMHFHGRHALERMPERAPLLHGIQEAGSRRGTSSHQQNPAVLLCTPDCTETGGTCIGAMLLYSGGFQARIELDQLEQTRLTLGLHPDLFRWRLAPGEHFHTPEAVLCLSSQGFEVLSHRLHRFIRVHICRSGARFARRPVLINSWEAFYCDINEARLLSMAKEAAALGMDMLVLDDGWFERRDNDNAGLGDWTVSRKKLPHGLDGLARELKAMGIQLGLWVEPECVSEDSDLYHAHPDWVLQIPGRPPVRARNQLTLDLSRTEVAEYLFQKISGILKNADISYIKWDMNRSICDWYSPVLPAERMGELPHRYVLGLYALLERLTAAFPNVLFEGCSGGGGRFDAGMLYYCPQIWCSDNTDAYERTKIQYGTSFFYPISAMGSHVSAVPNQQTGRVTSLEARTVTAMSGSFGYELDPAALTDAERDAIREQIVRYRGYQALIYEGQYYRLSDPMRDNIAAWMYVSEDKSRVLVHGMIYRAAPNALRRPLKLRGLDMRRTYRLEATGEKFTGAALHFGGMPLPFAQGDYLSFEWILLAE